MNELETMSTTELRYKVTRAEQRVNETIKEQKLLESEREMLLYYIDDLVNELQRRAEDE